MSHNQKNEVIELTDTQQNPGAVRGQDWTVRKYSDPIAQPFHGQHGDSSSELAGLLSESDKHGKPALTGKGAPRPTQPGHSGPPYMKSPRS